jgi:hypothetical protein
LDDLYPEYEVRDYNDGRRFIDHAYKPDGIRLALEADGFNPHIRDIDRWDHADNMLRDKHLLADGWTVIHYSSDVIRYRSRQAQQLLRQIVWGREGRTQGEELTIAEREAIRYGKRKGGSVSPSEVGAYLGRTRGIAANILQGLVRKQIYRPVNPESKQVRSYVLTARGRDIWL